MTLRQALLPPTWAECSLPVAFGGTVQRWPWTAALILAGQRATGCSGAPGPPLPSGHPLNLSLLCPA